MASTSYYDIKQITQRDLASYNSTLKSITIPKLNTNKTVGTQTKIVEYRIFTNVKICKLGYCCEPRAVLYPIFIKVNNDSTLKQININKSGIYEMQPETWQDANSGSSEIEEELTDAVIKEIQIPYLINGDTEPLKFTLEYALELS